MERIPADRLQFILGQHLVFLRTHRQVQRQGHGQEQEQEREQGQGSGPVRPRPRRYWVRRDLTAEHRLVASDYHTLLKVNMRDPDAQGKKIFLNYTRISAPTFIYILQLVAPRIAKKDTNLRKALSPGLKLACTMRYLATGDNFHSLGYAFNVAHNTVSKFVPEVCAAIVECLKDEAFPPVASPEDWKEIAERFEHRWNMPHCMGALDGKHMRIQAPANSGSLYYNYKGFFSIPMLALADADYRFLWLDLGGQGHMSDAQIFLQSDLYEGLESNRANRPAPSPLTDHLGDTEDVPYFIVADDAFGLRDYCIKPFSRRTMEPREKVFNYRLSRARRVVENAFGVLAMRFRMCLKPLETKPENTLLAIKAAVTLHNILMKRQPLPANAFDREEEGRRVDGEWRQLVRWMEGPRPQVGRPSSAGIRARQQLADYFGSPQGAVQWQWLRARVQEPPRAATTDEQ